jgi:hypothetical protein
MSFWKKLLAALGIAAATSGASAADQLQTQATSAAEQAVAIAKKVDGTNLDYSAESLKSVDRIVLGMRKDGTKPEQVQGTLFILGAYVGEVIVRNTKGARWTNPPKEIVAAGMDVMGVTTRAGVFLNPIGKVHKLLLNGEEDSVIGLYELSREKS